jgi:hypothetical protein
MRGFNMKTLYKGKYTLVDLVDETIEVTVQNNVYSLSETLELKQELDEIGEILLARKKTRSEEMQDQLEPIE